VILKFDKPQLVDDLVQVLEAASVVIMPCDTIYGFVAVAPEGAEKIRQLKGRQEKSFLMLIPSLDWLPRFTEAKLPEALEPYWPGPLTVIFPGASSGTVALRMPDDPLLVEVMRRLDRPLFSTSVNASGRPALWRLDEILRQFERRVAAVVAAGDRPGGVPSTIVDVTLKPFRVLRRGAVELPPQLLGA
jgi:L-threonylcarbamoyladenylate synthase